MTPFPYYSAACFLIPSRYQESITIYPCYSWNYENKQNYGSLHVPQKPLDPLHSQITVASSSSSQLSSGFKKTGFSTELEKKKRGRPRKYDNICLHDSDKSSKKWYAGSGKKKLDVLESAGVGFTPHVITVDEGEIINFSQQGPLTVCILSANGTIWNVTLSARQQCLLAPSHIYEGEFEIINLSGSYSLSDDNGSLNGIGSLSVSLAGPDGQVLGGVVAGELIAAATPVQIVIQILQSLIESSFNSSGDRGISGNKLFEVKVDKNLLEVIMSQERLNGLAILSIEKELLENIDSDIIIDDFASQKARRTHFL